MKVELVEVTKHLNWVVPEGWSVVTHGSYFLGFEGDPSDVDVLIATRDRGVTREAAAGVVAELLDPVARSLPIDTDVADPEWLSLMERAAVITGTQVAGPVLEVEPIEPREWATYHARAALELQTTNAALAALCAIGAWWANEGRLVLTKSAIPSEAVGGPWADLARAAWPARHGATFDHPDLASVLGEMPSILLPVVTMDDLVKRCHRDGGVAVELIDSGVASLPGQALSWRPGDREQTEPPAAMFDWWAPPHPQAMPDRVCDALVSFLGQPEARDAEPWRCDAWTLDAPKALAQLVADRVELLNTMWWRFDLSHYRLSVHRYRAGHAHPAHHDMLPGSMSRKLSLSIQLSPADAYEGGDLELLVGRDWHPAPRDRGTVVAMPGWLAHRVAPITGGERWSLVVSCYGPPVR